MKKQKTTFTLTQDGETLTFFGMEHLCRQDWENCKEQGETETFFDWCKNSYDQPGIANKSVSKCGTNKHSQQYIEWEDEIYTLIEEQADVNRSDAQGIAMIHESKFEGWYEAMKTPQDVVDVILTGYEKKHHPDCPAIDGFPCHCDELEEQDTLQTEYQQYPDGAHICIADTVGNWIADCGNEGNVDCEEHATELVRRYNIFPVMLAALKKAANWIDAQITTSNEITNYDREVYRDAAEAIDKAVN